MDLHWGLRGAPRGDQGAAEIFLQEVRRCQRTSAGPAFIVSPVLSGSVRFCPVPPRGSRDSAASVSPEPVLKALLGNRFGPRAPPGLLQEKLFLSLLSALANDPEGAEELRRRYRRDHNAVPPVYVLQPVAARFPRHDDLRRDAAAAWRSEEARLLELLRGAAEAAGDITAEEKRQFNTSGEVERSPAPLK